MTRRIVWSSRYEVDIGAHVFPTRKYRLVHDELVQKGSATDVDFIEPEPATEENLARAHTEDYLRKIREDDFSWIERQTLEVPFSSELASVMRLCCGGTLLTGRLARVHGAAVHLGGGFHHAFADHGEGFCLLNDVAVAIATQLAGVEVSRAAVIDLDVHHGNGTAAIFADEPRVFTMSMHQQANYPAVKPPSDLDVGLGDRVGDAEYLALLREHLPTVLDGASPDVVFYLAGADPYRLDQLGGLGLTLEGLRARDRTVLEACRGRGIPVAVVLAGGYAVDTRDTVSIHLATVEETLQA
jgi:acetoin utilization deacetylase AcuC-like enzyme